MNAIMGATEIARELGISISKVKYLWTGRTDRAGNYTPPCLNYRVDRSGRRFSTPADIRAYVKHQYQLKL